MNDIGTLLKFFDNSYRAEDINIILPCVNNLVKEIDNCFLRLDDRVLIYLISPDLFELIKYHVDYYKETQYCYYDRGRRLSLPGTYHRSKLIVDSSLTYYNYGWFISRSMTLHTFIYKKHKFIIS